MKSIFTLLCFIVLNYSVSQAQVRVALTGGVHSATVIEENSVPGFDEYQQDYQSRSAAHFGLIADIPFTLHSPVSFQPGVLFYGKGRKYFSLRDTAVSNTRSVSASQFINYMDIPLNLILKLKLGKNAKFILGGGPYAGLFYNGKEETSTLYKNGSYASDLNEDLPVGNAKGKYAVFNYGINGLAGFELGRVMLTANASMGLNDFYQSATYDGSFRHQVIGASLGIYLGKKPVTSTKIKDKDKDGVSDAEDRCPDLAGLLTSHGCPDKDNDGIGDNEDKCPGVAGMAKYNGCPVPGTDADGINDELDKCPSVAGMAKYNGCPVPDSDNDGINDEMDKCPAMAGMARYNGCPVPDTDHDGINDEEDKCPVVAGAKNNGGCPAINKAIVDKVNYAAKSIRFEQYKTTLTTASMKILGDVAAVLKEHPELKLVIEGHTSTEGNPQANRVLSEKRANAVKTYLVSLHIDAAKLTAIGFGMSKPLNNSKTPAAQAKNRRVELKLSN